MGSTLEQGARRYRVYHGDIENGDHFITDVKEERKKTNQNNDITRNISKRCIVFTIMVISILLTFKTLDSDQATILSVYTIFVVSSCWLWVCN